MGIPECIIEFKKRAKDFRFRSEQNVVALVLKDTTSAVKGKSLSYSDFREVKESDFTADNYDFIRLAFLGEPMKVIVEVIDDFEEAPGGRNLDAVLKQLELRKFNYLAIPELPKAKTTVVESWITEVRKKYKPFKAVLSGTTAKNEKGLINFVTEKIQVKDKTYTALQYTARIAGVLAGIPSTQSGTYAVLDEVNDIELTEDESAAVDEGKLILTNDGEKVKIVRAVTALTQVENNDIDSFKKIKIVDTADRIMADIKETWDNNFVGKVMNIYPNKLHFLNAVKGYYNFLQKEGVLDPNAEASSDIDIEEQIKYLKKVQVDVSKLTEQEVKEYNTSTFLFSKSNITIADAMEDLTFTLYLANE